MSAAAGVPIRSSLLAMCPPLPRFQGKENDHPFHASKGVHVWPVCCPTSAVVTAGEGGPAFLQRASCQSVSRRGAELVPIRLSRRTLLGCAPRKEVYHSPLGCVAT